MAPVVLNSRLVLGSWFPTRLRGLRPGGLPQDFLINGAPQLLLYDAITCDSDALTTELIFESQFLSASIYGRLWREGILQPTSSDVVHTFVTSYAMSPSHAAEVTAVQNLMADHLNDLPARPSDTQPYGARGLPAPKPLSTAMNQLDLKMLIAFAASLHDATPYTPRGAYGFWTHFRAQNQTTASPEHLTALEDPVFLEVLRSLDRSTTVAGGLTRTLARNRIPLLPRISAGAARDALQQNIALEQDSILRWMLGDQTLSIENFHDWRAHNRIMTDADAAIDNDRIYQARRNLDIILDARERTKDVRPQVRAALIEALGAARPSRALQRMLDVEIRAIAEATAAAQDKALNQRRGQTARNVAGGLLPGLIFAALEMLFGVPGPILTSADFGMNLALAARRRAQEHETAAAARGRQPLTAFQASIAGAADH